MTRSALAALLAALALALAACGGDDEDGGTTTLPQPDPATLVPADAPVFAEAIVRPEGDARAAIESALGRLLGSDDPGGLIVSELDDELAEEDLSWSRDVEPWLGSRAGIYFETFEDEPDGALILSSTDQAAATDAIERAAAADDAREREETYAGVDYLVDTDGDVIATLDEFVVVGSEQGFRDAVDALEGDSLADDAAFAERRSAAGAEWTVFAYADPRAVVDAVAESGEVGTAQLDAVESQLGAALDEPAAAALSATADSLALDLDAAAAVTPLPADPGLEEFPADSWLAFAGGGIAESYEQAFQQVPSAELDELRETLGFDLGAELSAWGGDVAGFVRGTSLLGIGGALVVETTDEAASAAALDNLRAALEQEPAVSIGDLDEGEGEGFTVAPTGVPIEAVVVQREGRIVAGLGQASVDAVFSPDETLADSDAFGAARDALGDDLTPSFYADFDTLLGLIATVPEATSDPDFQEAQAYLERIDFLAAGVRSEDDRTAGRVVLGLSEASEDAAADGAQAAVPWSAG